MSNNNDATRRLSDKFTELIYAFFGATTSPRVRGIIASMKRSISIVIAMGRESLGEMFPRECRSFIIPIVLWKPWRSIKYE